ncbi:MAG: hypothetical protein IPJ40_17755 [Saprospirales bacterium]|nr:hypothetical protein [Saprospirales bacterium]
MNEVHTHLNKKVKETKEESEKATFQSADKAVLEKIESIKAAESDPELKEIYRSFPDPKAK